MSKRYAFTTTTRLPASVGRDAVLDYLHNHEEFLACNPLVTEWRRIAPPAGVHPDEQKCAWFSVTEKSHSALHGRTGDDITQECSFYNLPDGIQTHVWATMGVDIRQRWIVEGALPGEPAHQPRSRAEAPLIGLHLREDVEMRCNVLMASSLKKSLRGSHAAHVKRLCEQAWLAPARPSRPRSTTATTMAYSKTPAPGLYAHELQPKLAHFRPLSHSTSDPETYTTRNPNHNRGWGASRDSSPGMTRGTRARLSLPPITTQFGPPSPAPPPVPVPVETTGGHGNSNSNSNNDSDRDSSLYPHPLRIVRHVSPAAHPPPSHRHSSAPVRPPPPPPPSTLGGTTLDTSRGTTATATMTNNGHLAPASPESARHAAPPASSTSSPWHLSSRGAETAKLAAARRPAPSPRSAGPGGMSTAVLTRQRAPASDQQQQQQQQQQLQKQQQSQRATVATTATTTQHPLYPMLNPYSDEGLSPIVLTEEQRAAILRGISDTLSAVREAAHAARLEEPARLTSATLNAPFAPEFYENFCLV
ncbi:uncharacterized protein E0L32_008521 [Thyridium curvatum]|uniref:DUF7053 domain-containing protein n=1 Tax=Thyridium curvatum TaxID=1093900 RepID=A0A507B026_9PEZI|nr:uncharacterized protein E0L32_008521 [Thyridium curvatum]TPX10471.1 hypothetical protein E0L32_008521 [Thyridium curvatum]